MCITSETCRANSVIKTALNNLHQAGPNKPIYNDAWKHKNQIIKIGFYISFLSECGIINWRERYKQHTYTNFQNSSHVHGWLLHMYQHRWGAGWGDCKPHFQPSLIHLSLHQFDSRSEHGSCKFRRNFSNRVKEYRVQSYCRSLKHQ